MSDEQVNAAAGDESKKYSESEAKLLEFIAECLDEGWCPTKCGQSCVVEPDGVCPHGFISAAIEYGLV